MRDLSRPARWSAWIGHPGARLGFGSSPLPIELIDAAEAGPDAAEEGAMDGETGIGKPVVGELPLPRDLDETGSMEVAKMTRDGGLRDREDLDEVADAELPGDEQIQDANPGRVREAPEEEIEIREGVGSIGRHERSHILEDALNLAKRI